jgi:hypothetical protein
MTGSESYLLDAGWLFFAGWSLVVFTVSVIAFGKDFVRPPSLFERERQGLVPGSNRSIGNTRA